MGFLDYWRNVTRPYDEDEDDYIDDAEVVEERVPETPRPNPFSGFGGGSDAASSRPSAVRPREGKLVNLSGGQSQLVLVRPERFETAAEIVDQLRGKRAVLINLETTPKDVTRRLVDFLSGAAYAIDGKVKKVAANTYLITPPNVDLVGDLMDELESTGHYF